MSCPANIIVYHGTRGPGKTDAQLMRFRRNVGIGYGRHWRGVIFDREYKNLDDLVSKSMRWFPEFNDGAKFVSSQADYKWRWPTGEELLFRAIKKETDYWNYHGQEFPFIGWNELTKYPNDELFDALMSCNRSSFRPQDFPIHEEDGSITYLPEIPLEVFATCNPYGAGHNWMKARFINVSRPGQVLKKTVNVFNPRTQQQEDVVKTQCHILGVYKENKYLSPEYVAELVTISDPNKRKAWLLGSWDIISGGMFDDVWETRTHVVRPFTIPASWKIDRSFDWGSSAPFSVGWWAESDGSDIKTADGKWQSTVRGDLYRIDEWYGWTGKANQGVTMLAKDVAAGIIEREIALGIQDRVKPGPADTSIFDVENGMCIADDMARTVRLSDGRQARGAIFTRADKRPGSRKTGWEQVRQMLMNAKKPERGVRERPGLFVFDTCQQFLRTFPVLPRSEKDPDDVDSDAEDHIADEVRYRVRAAGVVTQSITVRGLT